MRKLVKVALLTLAVFTFTNVAKAQGPKVGHINLTQLVGFMPEAAKANVELDTLSAVLMREVDKKTNELRVKYDDYKTQMAAGKLPPSIAKSREEELNRLQTELQNFQYQAQDDLDKQRQLLFKPIIDAAQKAIKDIAKEKGYTYVLDSSAGTILFSNDSDDLMSAVKTKLNIK